MRERIGAWEGTDDMEQRVAFRAPARAGLILALLCVACPPPQAGDGAAGGKPATPEVWVPPTPADVIGEEVAVLADPPNVPPPVARDHPTKVIVRLEVLEKVMRLADGVDYTFWTFGGSVPGKFIRVRRGDLVEFHLANHPENKVPHNIDLHAVTGPGGGAVSSFTPPGKATVFTFQALNPGLFIYHCATAPVGMHIANGMYGLILVEPEEGLSPVDREYHVVQGDFYTRGEYGAPGLQPFDMQKALREEPEYVVFNGAVGSLAGDGVLRAAKGERVRLFVGNGGPNLVSSFHVIGEIFDAVHDEGGSAINRNVQTTLVPAGGSAIVEFQVEVPGEFILVDHSIFRAFNKGALGKLVVEGEEDAFVYSGTQRQEVYLPEGGTAQAMPDAELPQRVAATLEERIALGRNVYTSTCAACHMPEGGGVAGAFPPLAASDFLNADVERAIRVVAEGLSGEVTVNGVVYDNVMPRLNLSHAEIADVLTYVYSAWENSGAAVTPEDVTRVLAN